jgi:hypothetical protein
VIEISIVNEREIENWIGMMIEKMKLTENLIAIVKKSEFENEIAMMKMTQLSMMIESGMKSEIMTMI